ncbi:hypothetical protein GCM10027046_20410 [Uliginosibacterium flavum]|uniref:DUF2726 domain-containing protein n=1 Tax=Uliginosibacterium flavum TaxID=1396831 RepID=A0ABV2TG15_9RHOO
MGWLILAAIFGVMGYFLFRAWKVWQERFANRHEFDADHLALLMAQREEFELPAEPAPTPEVLAMRKPRAPRAVVVASNPDLVAKPARKAAPVVDLHKNHRKAPPSNDLQPARRKPVLDAAAQSVFLQLRNDLNNFPVLAGVDIASLLDPHGPTPPRVQADFVVCKKDFSPVVVIFIERDQIDPMLDRAETLLRQHRLRVLRWPANALPDKEQMRLQIFKPKS